MTRLMLMLASGIGFASGMPSQSDAGVIPWVYNSIFGPVGSMRAGAAYSPYAAGYGSYGMGYSAYAPMSAAYIPTTVAYAPMSTAGYGSGCNCNQSSSYVPSTGYSYSPSYYGSTGCSSCGSGNCSSGTCSNCTVNSAPMSGPTTAGYGAQAPVPDPNNSRNENLRLYNLERKVDELDHRQKQDEKFLQNQSKDYIPETYVPSRRFDQGESVPARRKNDTFGSDPNSLEGDFSQPARTRHPRPSTETFPGESRKPVLGPPSDDAPTPDTQKSNESARGVIESEPEAKRLDNRVTSRAVAPRERLTIVKSSSKTAVATSTKKPVKTSETSPSAEIVRR